MWKKKAEGSMTVEMAILFPVIFLTILGILYLCIMHYQNVVSATAAMQAASRGAAYWDKLGGEGAWDFQTATNGTDGGLLVAPNYKEHDPYRYIIDTKTENKCNNIQAYAQWLQTKNPKVYEQETDGTPKVEKTGPLWQKYVSVTIEKHHFNPIQTSMEQIGLVVPTNTTVTASAPLNTPTEFIRNIAFIYDAINGYGYKENGE